MDVDEDAAPRRKPRTDQIEECRRRQMVRHEAATERVEHHRIERALLGQQILASVRHAARDVRRKPEISPRQQERMRIDVDDRQRAADPREHRRECPAAATDHQNAPCARLFNKTEDRVDIADKADPVLIRFALKAVTLDIEERSRLFAFEDRDRAKAGFSFGEGNHGNLAPPRRIGHRMARAVCAEMSKEMLICGSSRGD